MTTVAVNIVRQRLADELLDVVLKKLKKVTQKKLVKQLGKRAVGLLASLLVPDITVSKIIAIGFGVWMAWDLIDAIFEFLAMKELIEGAFDITTEKILEHLVSQGGIDSEALEELIKCLKRCLTEAMTKYQANPQNLDRIIDDMKRCMLRCAGIPIPELGLGPG